MSLLATAPAKHNADEDECESQKERDNIAQSREHWWRLRRWREDGVDDPGSAPWKLLHDTAAGVDHGTDAGRSGPKHGEPFLGRAETGLRQMLRWAPAAEPGIVGRVEDELRPIALVYDVAREDDLVAKLKTDLAPRQPEVDRPRSRSRREVELARRKAR